MNSVFLSSFSVNLLALYHECSSLIAGLDLGSGQLAKYHWIVSFG